MFHPIRPSLQLHPAGLRGHFLWLGLAGFVSLLPMAVSWIRRRQSHAAVGLRAQVCCGVCVTMMLVTQGLAGNMLLDLNSINCKQHTTHFAQLYYNTPFNQQTRDTPATAWFLSPQTTKKHLSPGHLPTFLYPALQEATQKLGAAQTKFELGILTIII